MANVMMIKRSVVFRCKNCSDIVLKVDYSDFCHKNYEQPHKYCDKCQKNFDDLRILRKWIKSREV